MPSTDLLARYLQAVGLWLPRATKRDILAEISEDLHSQMEERAASLNRPLNKAEVAEILKRRGHPVVVASAYLPQQSLIGPVFYPSYKLTIKIILFCYVIPWLLFCAGLLISSPHQVGSVSTLIHSLLPWWFSVLNTIAITTVVFCALDRGWLRTKFANDWNPNRLPRVQAARCVQPRGRAADIAGIVFGFIGLGWLLAVPNFPFLVLGPAAFLVKAEPIWRTVYPLVFLLVIAQIAEHVLGLMSNVAVWVRPVFKFVTDGFALWIASLLLRAHSYFTAAAQQTQQYASITNQVAYVCVRGVALGLAIALVIQAWRVFQGFQRPSPPAVTHMA